MRRGTLATRLRRLADRLEPPSRPRSPAPLIRLGGLWWRRDEVGQLARIEPQDPGSS
jgi:hypothetical protein